MKTALAVTSLIVFAVPCLYAQTGTVSTYEGTTVVTPGPAGPAAWQLTSEYSGTPSYSGVEIDFSSPLTPDSLTTLSADIEMLQGTFGGGAPRFSIADATGEAYVYIGTPDGSGGFTDPAPGTYESTGNLADALSTDAIVQNNGFDGKNSGYPAETWAAFLSQVGTANISTIYFDLDGGFTGTQVADVGNININGTVYNPAATPEPSSLLLLGTTLLAAAGVCRRRISLSR